MRKLEEAVKEHKENLKKSQAALNDELDAFADYYERTGVSGHCLSSVEQRKIIEKYKEDHQC